MDPKRITRDSLAAIDSYGREHAILMLSLEGPEKDLGVSSAEECICTKEDVDQAIQAICDVTPPQYGQMDKAQVDSVIASLRSRNPAAAEIASRALAMMEKIGMRIYRDMTESWGKTPPPDTWLLGYGHADLSTSIEGSREHVINVLARRLLFHLEGLSLQPYVRTNFTFKAGAYGDIARKIRDSLGLPETPPINIQFPPIEELKADVEKL